MKIAQSNRRQPHGIRAAFTLPEMMIAITVFSMLIAAMVAIQLFGARVYTLAATKISATTDARKTMNALRDTIRSANTVMVGSYASGGFIQESNGLPQVGNALAILYTNALATNYLIFYKDTNSSKNTVYSLTNGVTRVLANYVTNNNCFQAEDYQGNILTNYQNNPVIRVTLQFYQWEYPIGIIGSNAVNAYNFYQLRTRVARRAK